MRLIFFFIISTICVSNSLAQIAPATEINADMNLGKNRAWKILIPKASKKSVEKGWSSLMKDYGGKTSKVKKSEDFMSEEVKMPSISETPLTVFSQMNETPEGVYLTVFYQLNQTFLNGDMHAEHIPFIQSLMQKFAQNTTIEAIEDELKSEEKKLDKIKKSKSSLEKNKIAFEKDIKDAEELIKKRQNDLVKNAEDYEKVKVEETEQNIILEKGKEELKKFK